MSSNRSFWRAGHLPTLVSAFLYFDVSFMVWVLLGALGNYIAADFGLSPAQKGLMTAIPLLAGSVLRLVFGYLTDTIGAKNTGCLGLALTLAPLMAGWQWADSLGKVYLAGLQLGAAGASFAAALPLASRWYPPKHQGLVMGIAGAGTSGTLLATLFAPRLAEAFGWHAVFGLAIIPLSVVMLIFCLAAKEAPQTEEGEKEEHIRKPTNQALTPNFSRWEPEEQCTSSLGDARGTDAPSLLQQAGGERAGMKNLRSRRRDRRVGFAPAKTSEFISQLKERDTSFFSLFYAVTFGGFVGLASFLAIFLKDQYGVSKIQAGDLTCLCVLAGSLLRPVGGFLADELGGIRMLMFLYSAVGLLLIAVATLPPLPFAVGLLFMVMAGLGMGNGSVFQLLPQRFEKRVGVATGILGAAGGLGGFFLPTILGALKQLTGSYGPGLLVFAGLCAVALGALHVVQREWIGDWIAEGGRARSAAPVFSAPEVEIA